MNNSAMLMPYTYIAILLTKIKILNADGKSYTSLALAPVAVLQTFQGNGVGTRKNDNYILSLEKVVQQKGSVILTAQLEGDKSENGLGSIL